MNISLEIIFCDHTNAKQRQTGESDDNAKIEKRVAEAVAHGELHDVVNAMIVPNQQCSRKSDNSASCVGAW